MVGLAIEKVRGEEAKCTRRGVCSLTRPSDLQEDAHTAEERANSLDRSAGEHEGRHRALEAMVQKLQKKLDTCVSDRGVLSSVGLCKLSGWLKAPRINNA